MRTPASVFYRKDRKVHGEIAMARSRKKGIDYFSMDVTIFADRKVRRVVSACGLEAMAVLMRILCEIYKEEGYFVAVDDDLFFDIGDELGADEKFVLQVVNKCIDVGLFDKGMHDTHGILTSRRIQSNYIDATKKRTVNKGILPEHLLVSGAQSSVSGAETTDTAPQTDVSGSNGTQSKVKKSKEKKTKAHQSTNTGERVRYAKFVHMQSDEYDDLVKTYGEDGAKRMIEMLNNYKGASGKRYESDYRAILSWAVKRWQEECGSTDGGAMISRPTENYDHLAINLFKDG